MGKTSTAALQRALLEGRRSARRFDARLTLRYTATRSGEAPISGGGESVNISRTGMLFRAAGKLNNNDSLIVVLDWPYLAPNGEPLKLVLTGQVVRTKRPLIGMAVHTYRLLRGRDVEKRFDSFWAPTERVRQQRMSDARPIVLVDADDATAALISVIVSPHKYPIERVDSTAATGILEEGDPPVALVVTRTIDVFRRVREDVPAIFIGQEAVELPETERARLGKGAVLHQPIEQADLRTAIGEALGVERPRAQSAGGTV